jgi:beta-lactamase class C
MKKISFTSCILFLLIACNAPAKKENTDADLAKKRKQERLDKFLHQYEAIFKTNFATTEVPGAAVAIVKDSSIIYMKGFGIRELGKPDSVDVHTVFRIASLSKGFTTVLVSLLVQKGILKWDDYVIDYLPDFELKDTAQTKRIQIKHLLSHTTGLPKQSLIEKIEDGETMEQMMPQLKSLRIEGKEGEFFGYQNVAFSIIQEIIRIKTNKSMEQWMQEEIFSKAGMKHASMTYEALMNDPNKALPHIKNDDKDWEIRPIHDKYYNTAAAGGINASISDMAQWLLVLLGNRPDITPQGSLDYIFTPYIYQQELGYFENWTGITKSAYGMGWRLWLYHGRKIIYHGGSVNDYKTEIAFDPENKIGICIMFNAQNHYSRAAVPNFLDCYDLYESMEEAYENK